MIKSIFLIFLIFTTIITFGQAPPEFQSNDSKEKMAESIILNNMKGAKGFEFILAYRQLGSWNTGIKYTVLGYYKGNWKAFNWVIYYKSKERTPNNIRKTKRRHIRIKQNQLDSIFYTLDSNNFWDLNIDSLNVYEGKKKPVNDSLKALGIVYEQDFYNLTDGMTWAFEIINKSEYRFLSSYAPDYFQNLIPIQERLKFINCKNAFLRNLRRKKSDG